MAQRYSRLDEGHGLGAVGKGSFGRVYAAVGAQSKMAVAVKRQQFPSDAAQRELSFYKALSHAKHRNVLELLDHFVEKKYLYMVFPFCDISLYKLWEGRRGVIAPAQAHGLLSQACAGVAHLHAFGVMHTDLSMGICWFHMLAPSQIAQHA